MRILTFLVGLLLGFPALAWFPHGAIPGAVTGSPSATTIYAAWTTSGATTTTLACGTTLGTYNIPAVVNGIQTSVTSHWAVVAGLAPSTTYYCRTGDGNLFSVATAAPPSSVPLVSATLGTPTTPIANQVHGDFFENCVSTDNLTHVATDDIKTPGWSVGAAYSSGANMSANTFSSESPLTGANQNGLSNFGAFDTELGDGNTSKITGMTCRAGAIYLSYARLHASSTPFGFLNGSILKSIDLGASWSNGQAPNSYSANGSVPSPLTYTPFANSNIGSSCTFVSYGPDTGSNIPSPRVDNADAYTYLICNDGTYNGTQDHVYLIRIPWQSMPGLDATQIEYYIGGSTGNGQDGSLDAAWSTSAASIAALPIPSLTASQLGVPTMQYMATTGRYVLVDAWNKVAGTPGDTLMDIWDCAHPWEIDTLISGPTEWTPGGFYSHIALQRTAANATANGTPMTFLFSGNFDNDTYYQLWSMTIVLNTH